MDEHTDVARLVADELREQGFEKTDIRHPSRILEFFPFNGKTHAFDHEGSLWEKDGQVELEGFFEKTEPVLWESEHVA